MAKKESYRLRTSDGQKFDEAIKELGTATIVGVANAAAKLMDSAAAIATSVHMVPTRGLVSAAGAKVHPTKVTWRSGRLARSLLNAFTFKKIRIPATSKVKLGVKPKTVGTVDGKEGVRELKYVKGRGLIGTMGSKVEYAEIHEFGGTVSRTSKLGKSFTATYPERPFLAPAIKDRRVQGSVKRIVKEELKKVISKQGWKVR